MRIGIVGTGWVGSSIAISTVQSGIATELLLNDARGGAPDESRATGRELRGGDFRHAARPEG